METSPAYGLEQARTQLPRLVAEAHAGTQSIITKHGKPYAAIVPLQDAARAANRGSGVLNLRGSGAGLWGADVAATVVALRGEWEAPWVATQPAWAGLRAGSTVLVDTAPLIYWLEGHPVFAERFAGMFQAAASGDLHIALSTITLAEVLTGPYQAGQTALARRYENALQHYRVVDITPAIAILGAQLRAQYRLKLPDALQLACTLDMGADAVVTHDRDFSRVGGVVIVTGNTPGASR